MIYAYPCDLTPDEDGGLVATFPDVPYSFCPPIKLIETHAYISERWSV